MRPSQRATGAGIGSPETGKFSTALRVSPPQSSRCASVATISSVTRRGRSQAAPPGFTFACDELRDRRALLTELRSLEELRCPPAPRIPGLELVVVGVEVLPGAAGVLEQVHPRLQHRGTGRVRGVPSVARDPPCEAAEASGVGTRAGVLVDSSLAPFGEPGPSRPEIAR